MGQFAILGVDLMPTLDGGMYLLEFTKSPAFRVSPSALEELHRPLLQDTIDVMFEVGRRQVHRMPVDGGACADARGCGLRRQFSSPTVHFTESLSRVGHGSWDELCG